MRQIARHLNVALSSVSLWTRNEPVSSAADPPAPEAEIIGEPVGLKVCPRCMRILLESDFNRLGDGRQGWCRECFSDYFKERGQLHLDQSSAAKKLRVTKARAVVEEHLATHPCADCGVTDRVVLEFDHVGKKRG